MLESAVIFENDGEIDIRALRTFGVSAKVNDNPIGLFGTGAKYAIAILLRHGIGIELLAGEDRYRFEKKEVSIRGKEFELIMMNDQELPFTTKLGQTWEVWQAFRELYCNCVDEKGVTYLSSDDQFPEKGKTRFIVKGHEFLKAFQNVDDIILNLPETLLLGRGTTDVYNRSSRSAYYRGIRIWDTPKLTMFTYNFMEELELTEDRTLKHSHVAENRMVLAIAGLKDKNTIRRAITADDCWFESSLSFNILDYYSRACSTEFMEVLETSYKSNTDHMSHSAKEYFLKHANKSATKHYTEEAMTAVEKKQLKRVMDICLRVWPDFSDYKIMIVKTLGEVTVALADTDEQTIVLAKRSFELGTKFLMATVIEEYMHLKTGHRDCTRQLQTYLFDSLCSLIENHVIGEPV